MDGWMRMEEATKEKVEENITNFLFLFSEYTPHFITRMPIVSKLLLEYYLNVQFQVFPLTKTSIFVTFKKLSKWFASEIVKYFFDIWLQNGSIVPLVFQNIIVLQTT